jgi:hypothetical protein
MGVTSVGLALMVPNPIAIAATIVPVLSIQMQVRAVEEPYLVRVHGTAYVAYAARVGRFVPRVGVMRAHHTHGRRQRRSRTVDGAGVRWRPWCLPRSPSAWT